MSLVTFQEQRGETLSQPVTWRPAGMADICATLGTLLPPTKGSLNPVQDRCPLK